VKKRSRALANRELDEGRPVEDPRHERRKLDISGGVGTTARAQQQQSRFGTQVAARGHGPSYDVVLVRCPLPMLVRCAVLQFAFVSRQHVVVSAPKMLLGASVGFS
jgi:hypothetical protein